MSAGYSPVHKETLKNSGFYKTTAWRRIRRLALQRDHYLCQGCMRKRVYKKATEVHHIIAVDADPTLALSLDNLESLCRYCHEDTKSRGKIVTHVTLASGAKVRVIAIR